MKLTQLIKGQLLFTQGEVAQYFYIVCEGEFRRITKITGRVQQAQTLDKQLLTPQKEQDFQLQRDVVISYDQENSICGSYEAINGKSYQTTCICSSLKTKAIKVDWKHLLYRIQNKDLNDKFIKLALTIYENDKVNISQLKQSLESNQEKSKSQKEEKSKCSKQRTHSFEHHLKFDIEDVETPVKANKDQFQKQLFSYQMSPYEKFNQKIAQKLMQNKQDLKDLKLYEYNQEELQDIKELNSKKKMKNKSPVFKTNLNVIDFQIKQLKQSNLSQLKSQSSNSPRDDKSPRSATVAENQNFWQNYNQKNELEDTKNNESVYDLRRQGTFTSKARKSSLNYSVRKYSDQPQVSVPMTGSFQMLPDVNSARSQFNVFISESPIQTKKFQSFLEAAKDVQNQAQNNTVKSKYKSSNISLTPKQKLSPLILPNIQPENKESNNQDSFPTKTKSKLQYQIKGINLQKNFQQQITYQRLKNFEVLEAKNIENPNQISTPLNMKNSAQKKERNKSCKSFKLDSPTIKIFKDEEREQK